MVTNMNDLDGGNVLRQWASLVLFGWVVLKDGWMDLWLTSILFILSVSALFWEMVYVHRTFCTQFKLVFSVSSLTPASRLSTVYTLT